MVKTINDLINKGIRLYYEEDQIKSVNYGAYKIILFFYDAPIKYVAVSDLGKVKFYGKFAIDCNEQYSSAVVKGKLNFHEKVFAYNFARDKGEPCLIEVSCKSYSNVLQTNEVTFDWRLNWDEWNFLLGAISEKSFYEIFISNGTACYRTTTRKHNVYTSKGEVKRACELINNILNETRDNTLQEQL